MYIIEPFLKYIVKNHLSACLGFDVALHRLLAFCKSQVGRWLSLGFTQHILMRALEDCSLWHQVFSSMAWMKVSGISIWQSELLILGPLVFLRLTSTRCQRHKAFIGCFLNRYAEG